MVPDVVHEDRHRPADDVLPLESLARVAQHRPQRAKRVLDECEPELVHAREVAIERGRDDPGRLRHAAQAEGVEARARLDEQVSVH
jgi:hypothetical protein